MNTYWYTVTMDDGEAYWIDAWTASAAMAAANDIAAYWGRGHRAVSASRG